jgi:AraC-like DNA-binding protein
MPTVRPIWSHAVASALQRVVGEILDADAERFADAFRRLALCTPEPANIIECRELHARYMEFTLRVGSDFHAMAHRISPIGDCQFLPLESTTRIWFDGRSDPRLLLTMWATAYAAGFAQHHPTPLAWHAARLLGQRFAESLATVDVARELGASTSTLVRRFTDSFGLTLVEYRARTWLVRAFTELRERGAKVDDAARSVGFASVKNFNLASKKYARLNPSAVRQLSGAEFRRLVTHELQIDAATLEWQKSKGEHSQKAASGRKRARFNARSATLGDRRTALQRKLTQDNDS